MARIRTIKPEFWTSEQIVECSTNARLLFIGLWNFSDDAGRHPASCKRLQMEVFPGDDFTTSDISKMVDELATAGLIVEYEAQGIAVWQVTGWEHQKIDRPRPSKLPEMPKKSSSVRRARSEGSPLEGKGREGKGMEEEEEDARAREVIEEGEYRTQWREAFVRFVEGCYGPGKIEVPDRELIAEINRLACAVPVHKLKELREATGGKPPKGSTFAYLSAVKRDWESILNGSAKR